MEGDKLDNKFDIVSFCGVFNIHTDNGDEYMKNLLSQGWCYTKKCMTFNFISTYVNFRDDDMEYHNPIDIMKFVIENLSEKVEIRHKYEKCDVMVRVFK